MCHERWITHSDAAVERSWLRSLSQRDREEPPAPVTDREPDIEAREHTPQLEVVGER
jgi:hypothetical protein